MGAGHNRVVINTASKTGEKEDHKHSNLKNTAKNQYDIIVVVVTIIIIKYMYNNKILPLYD